MDPASDTDAAPAAPRVPPVKAWKVYVALIVLFGGTCLAAVVFGGLYLYYIDMRERQRSGALAQPARYALNAP